MNEERNVEKLYDLVELYDFEDLPKTDKHFVLQNFSPEEYNNLRSTITDTKELFRKYPGKEGKTKKISLKTIANYPVQLYKIAAVILFLIAFGFPVSRWQATKNSGLIAMADTVYIGKTDTVFIEHKVTVEQVRIIKHQPTERENGKLVSAIITEKYQPVNDCSIEICPNDIQRLSSIGSRNDFSEDKDLAEFLVSIN